jgi:hypothetical protein
MDKTIMKLKKMRVPMAASQIPLMSRRGIKDKPRIVGEKASNPPINVPTPRPPAKLKSNDQLWPIIATIP